LQIKWRIYKIIDSESPLGPVISTIDNQEINEDEPTTLEVIANGGDELTYFVESDTSSMPVYMDGSSIAIGLETNWSGTGTITVTVTNENDLSDTTSFEVVVLPVNDAPGSFNLISPLVDSLFINNSFRQIFKGILTSLSICILFIVWSELITGPLNSTPSGKVTMGLPYPFLNDMFLKERIIFYSTTLLTGLLFYMVGWTFYYLKSKITQQI